MRATRNQSGTRTALAIALTSALGCAADATAPHVLLPEASPTGSLVADAGPPTSPEPVRAIESAPVEDLALREVALYQAVKITLVRDGAAIAPSAPIIAGRDALLRVFVEPRADYVPREVIARVQLGDGPPLEARATITAASDDADLPSTLNVTIPGDRIGPGVPLSVGVYDVQPDDAELESDGVPARFPLSGTIALEAQSAGGALRIVLVPVRYLGDGSGRLPDTGDANVRAYADRIGAMFPAPDVEVTVRSQPLDWSAPIGRDGSGWSALLNACLNLRTSDAAPSDTYYYCFFAPAESPREFCGRSCVAGLGPVPDAAAAFYRASIGLGYLGTETTFVHEVGHSLGRPHAPCGAVSEPDPEYPYPGGSIGSWGYDISTGTLKSPARYTDVLGYCDDAWISDFNYARIFERIRAVRGTAALVSGAVERYATIVVDVDGSLSWGDDVELAAPPSGERVAATWSAPSGITASAEAIFVAVSHVAGGIVYVPLETPGADRVELSGLGSLAR